MSIMQRGVAAIAMVAGAALISPTPGLAAPPPVEHFTRWAAIQDVVVSPSGNRLAVSVFGPTGYLQVGVMDLDSVGQPRLVGGFEDADAGNVHWVSDDRLVYSALQRGPEVRDGGGGTFAVDHDGNNSRVLIAFATTPGRVGSMISTRVLPWEWQIHSATDDGSEDIFVARLARDDRGDLQRIELARLNTRTGTLRNLAWGMPEGARHWLTDAKREPRMVTAEVKGRVKIYWRAGADWTWTEVADYDAAHENEAGFLPLMIDVDGRVFVERRHGNGSALYAFDPATRRTGAEPLLALAGFDLSPRFHVDTRTRRLAGVQVRADRRIDVWFDPTFQRLQRSIDAALPLGRTNLLYCGRCESTRFVVVYSGSDRHPGEYYLYDRSKSSMQRLAARRPWIDEATQGRRSFHRVATRDGLPMPLFVTHPPQARQDEPLPAVVMVHGGPWVRGTDLSWNPDAQFLASRGYRVLEPEFRGSQGYGLDHFRAGWKQWGRAMQDDLADAVQWAVAQKLVDPSRVCVYGNGYGGYASLMAPISHPATFRCAASVGAAVDIDLMYSIAWRGSGFSENHKSHGMPVLIGDREKDAAMLAAASPLKRVGEIKVPVLLAHGAADRRVPLDHAKQFVSAAREAGVAVEPVYYTNEALGWFDPANHADFLSRLERFLAKSLQPVR